MSNITDAIAKLDIHHAQAALAAEGISASDEEVHGVLARLRAMPERELTRQVTRSSSPRGNATGLALTQAEGASMRAGRSATDIASCLFRYVIDVSSDGR
jgi:hypothetical protein